MIGLENHPYYYHYQIGKQKFSTKLFALYAREKLQDKQITWHFPNWENSLSKIDTTKEPEESLQDLYLRRAIQLRNEYDYLILHYTGGDDSHQILETFMLNNIFIDEIAVHTYNNDKLKSILQDHILLDYYHEPIKSAIPQARFYIDTFSQKTKLTIINDVYGINISYWYNFDESKIQNYLKSCSLGIQPRLTFRNKDLTLFNKEWQKITEMKKVGHIYGKEKVKLNFDSVGYYIHMTDINVVDFIDLSHVISQKDLPNNMELFFIHPNFVKIHVKQAHLILNNLKKEEISSYNNKVYSTRKIEDLYSGVIYKFKNKRLFTGPKYADATIELTKNKNLSENKLKKYLSIDYFSEYTMALYNNEISHNYKKVVDTIQTSFFPKKSLENVVDFFDEVFSTNKHYVRYHNGNTQ